ncbi:MAG TPA: CDP-glucose 4,6-dehydratase [Burkholderiaceae bacterium]|nr:CDP-glucose 4,6-dehydratase [Burkholderiaceae bacterium]
MALNGNFTPDPAFWRGRRVLMTGHTGFKGAWLTFWLSRMGAHVTGLSLEPTTQPNLFDLLNLHSVCDHNVGDIRNAEAVKRIVTQAHPEVILHLAAQALVRPSYLEPVETFATNVMGTVHVLDALRDMAQARVAVMVTTDKVYRNREWVWPYREDDALGGHDPYSASKAASEIAIESWRLAFLQERGVAVASARAGNVIGGGDWSQDRLIPDAVRAWRSGHALHIRRPQAVRPWQHVIEPLSGYLALVERLWQRPDQAGAYNFGPLPHEALAVRDVIEIARRATPEAKVVYGESLEGPHEAGLLSLDPSKARTTLQVRQRFSLQEAVERTFAWYSGQARGECAGDLCANDIAAWMASE